MLAKEDFNNDQVDAGDIGAGHTVTAPLAKPLSQCRIAVVTTAAMAVSVVLPLYTFWPYYELPGVPVFNIALLSLGMGALFLDLAHKLYVWRVYAAFEPASPMSCWHTLACHGP